MSAHPASRERAAIDPNAFRAGMRRLAASVSIIAAYDGGERHGLAATAVSSVSAEPPILLICVNRSGRAHDAILRAKAFSVNVLTADQAQYALPFSTPNLRAERFRHGDWRSLENGVPVLADALVAFDCNTVQTSLVGTHTVFFGRVTSVFSGLLKAPLTFFNGSFGTHKADETRSPYDMMDAGWG